MVNKKDLRAGVASMRKTAAFLQQWADDLESSLGKKPVKEPEVAVVESVAAVDESAAVEEPAAVAVEEVAAVEAEPAAAGEVAPAPELTLGEMQKILGEKSAQGFRTQVGALVCSYGVRKLSELDPKYYAELVEAVAGLGGGDGDAG